MNVSGRRIDPGVLVATALLVLSALSLLFMSNLVAAPKLLFGRALTAIAPTLFPYIVLGTLFVLSAIFLVRCLFDPERLWLRSAASENNYAKGLVLFAIMLFYALTMNVFGFLASSALSLGMIAVLVGSRNPLQIALTMSLPPIMLYLAATRLLAVALPELSPVEFFYANLLWENVAAGGASQ